METAADRILARVRLAAAAPMTPPADPGAEDYDQRLSDLEATVSDLNARLSTLEEAAVQDALEEGDWAIPATAALPEDRPSSETPAPIPEA